MRKHSAAKSALCVAALGLGLALAGACAKKGSGKGKRATRPGVENLGTLQDDGDENQNPPGKPDKPQMDAEAVAILAACFNIDKSEVAYVQGWNDPTQARAAATALCATLEKAKYKDGVSLSASPVAID